MARIGIVQPSFVAGELTPRLFGRTEFARYDSGAETLENFIVRPEGGLIRRHGTRFLGETRDSTKLSLLVPFIVSTIQAYMLEFGPLTVRFWKNNAPIVSATKNVTGITQANPAVVTSNAHGFVNGARVLLQNIGGMSQVNNREFIVAGAAANTFQLQGIDSTLYDPFTSGGTASSIYEIATPYLEADLATLFTTQSADTLFITQPSHPPMTLQRVTDLNWTLILFPQDKGPWASLNADDSKRVMCDTTTGRDVNDPVTITATANIFTPQHVGSFFYMEEMYWADNAVYPYGTDHSQTGVAPGIGDQVSNDGNVYECIAKSGSAQGGQVPPTHTIGEAWDAPETSPNRALWRYLHSRWAVISLDTYTDAKNMAGKIKTRLPDGLDPNSNNVTGASVSGSGSGEVVITTNGAHLYGVGDYVQVAGVGGVAAANGIWRLNAVSGNSFTLEGSVFSGAFTSGGTVKRYATFLWRYSAFSDARGWPATIAIHEQRLCWANSAVQPFGFWASKAGDYYEYRPMKQEDDDTISYNIASNQVDTIRWLMSAPHILFGTLSTELTAYGGGLGDPITPSNTRIVPQSGEGSNATPPVKAGGVVLFVNRAGRKLFSLSFASDVDQFVAADVIELAAHLTVGKTIVRMAWAKNPLSALWVLFSDGTLATMTYRPEQQIIAWARHPMPGAFIENVAVIPSQSGMNDDVWMIARRTINGVTRRYIERVASPFEPTSPTDKTNMGYIDCALNYSGAPVTTLSGLAYLEGQSVQIVADGARRPDLVVTGGKIVLDLPASNVWVGLAYTSRLRTLRPDKGLTVGTGQAKTKRAARVTVRVMNAIGGKAGPYDESIMDDIVQRDQADPMDASSPLFTGDRDVFLATDYGTDGRISIVQDEPMPLDVLSIMPLMTTSEG